MSAKQALSASPQRPFIRSENGYFRRAGMGSVPSAPLPRPSSFTSISSGPLPPDGYASTPLPSYSGINSDIPRRMRRGRGVNATAAVRTSESFRTTTSKTRAESRPCTCSSLFALIHLQRLLLRVDEAEWSLRCTCS